MGDTDAYGEDFADFVRRVAELRSARALPPEERESVLDAALFELQHAAETLWPRYERLAAEAPNGTSAERQERQLLRTLFQRLPLPVALVDRDTVVRRMNAAATALTGVRAGYATGRPLAALLTPGDRARFRTQAAAVARGEGGRSLTVRLQPRPKEPVRATLAALMLPGEPQPTVVVVLQPGAAGTRPPGRLVAGGAAVRRLGAVPDLVEATERAGTLDLVDTVAAAMLRCPPGDSQTALEAAARVLHERFADWVVGDLADGATGPYRRTVVLGPLDDDALAKALAEQAPVDCPLVVEVGGGSASLQVRPENPQALGADASGAAVLVRAGVSSLLCLPLVADGAVGAAGAAGAAPEVLGVLTLLRTGARRAFSMAEAQAADVVSRHVALAMRRHPA